VNLSRRRERGDGGSSEVPVAFLSEDSRRGFLQILSGQTIAQVQHESQAKRAK
jgi:hypothetical protein